MKRNKILFAMIIICFIQPVLAFEISCEYETGGMIIWSNSNLSEENLTALKLLIATDEEYENCTFNESKIPIYTFENCKKHYEPVIEILNDNIRTRNKKIKITSVFVYIILIAFVGQEIYLWWKRKSENGN